MKKNSDELAYEFIIIGLVIGFLLLSPIYINRQMELLNNNIDCHSAYCYGVR